MFGSFRLIYWVASGDKTAKRWEVETGKCEATYEHPDFVKSVAVSGAYLITGCRDENIRIWDMAVRPRIVFTGKFNSYLV